MSSSTIVNTAIAELMQHVNETASLSEKKSELERMRIEKQYESFKHSKAETERLSKVDVTSTNDRFTEKMDKEHDQMRQSLKNRLPFVNKELSETVPFSYPNLVLIGAMSGHGKSTFLANIVYPMLMAKKRAFVITNEEMSVNVYNRVACLNKGYNINRFQSFTDEQHEEIKKLRRILYESKRLQVVDSDFPDMKDATITLEGLRFILDKLIEEQIKNGDVATYDVVLLDYIQKIDTSKENPKLAGWEVQKKVADMLDIFYKRYHAPVVIFSQLKPEDSEGQDIEYRIKGGKSIYVSSTYAMELKPFKDQRMTEFRIHKHRFSDRTNSTLQLGHENGRYIPYTNEFKVKVATSNAEREHRDMLSKVFKGAKDEKKED